MTDKITNIIYVGGNIEARVVFKNVLSNLEGEVALIFFYSAMSACDYINASKTTPDIVLVDIGNELKSGLLNIESIKNSLYGSSCRILVFDTESILTNTVGVFSMGADAYIHKPYDYVRLKKALQPFIYPRNVI